MKYMLLMQAPQKAWAELMAWPPQDIEAHIAYMQRLNGELRKSGELVSAEGLAPPDQAKIVRAGKGGTPAMTDGPFPETKEFLAGWWIIDCETPERAYAIAARASRAPGRGGAPMSIPIEVRQVMRLPGEEM